MSNKAIDVLVYIQRGEQSGMASNAVKQLSHMPGVIGTRVNPNIKRLVSVQYDPEQLSGSAILHGIQKNGCIASLIGM